MREPYGITIFCDDIRNEVGGKTTYVGVYQSVLNVVSAEPVNLPILAICPNIMVPSLYEYKKLRLVIQHQIDDKITDIVTIEETENLPKSSDPEKFNTMFMHVKLSPFRVDVKTSNIKVRAYFDEKEIKLGQLQVNLTKPESDVGLAEKS